MRQFFAVIYGAIHGKGKILEHFDRTDFFNFINYQYITQEKNEFVNKNVEYQV